jgi:hypothetical protein
VIKGVDGNAALNICSCNLGWMTNILSTGVNILPDDDITLNIWCFHLAE